MPLASDYFVRVRDVRLDPPGVSDRQWRGIDDDQIDLDLYPHVVEGMTNDVLHDENYYLQSSPMPMKIQLNSNRARPFEAFRCERVDSCVMEYAEWAVMEVQCNLKCDLNQRPKDLNHDPGALLICDLVTSVGFVVVAAAIGRDDDLAALELVERSVVPFQLKYHKCGADSG